jgi:hypothetical protein
LTNDRIDGLIAALNRKADIPAGTTAKALYSSPLARVASGPD